VRWSTRTPSRRSGLHAGVIAHYGEQPFSRGALYLILRNRLYRGEMPHKSNAYPGEHAAIVDQALWDEVQAALAANRVERAAGVRTKRPSLLKPCRAAGGRGPGPGAVPTRALGRRPFGWVECRDAHIGARHRRAGGHSNARQSQLSDA
jgi:hypothetical protein